MYFEEIIECAPLNAPLFSIKIFRSSYLGQYVACCEEHERQADGVVEEAIGRRADITAVAPGRARNEVQAPFCALIYYSLDEVQYPVCALIYH